MAKVATKSARVGKKKRVSKNKVKKSIAEELFPDESKEQSIDETSLASDTKVEEISEPNDAVQDPDDVREPGETSTHEKYEQVKEGRQ